MTIIYNDGSTLECSEIEISYDVLIADGYRTVPIEDIEKITD